MKLYRVEVRQVLYVYALTHDAAELVARQNVTGEDPARAVLDVRFVDNRGCFVDPDWRNCLPYGYDGRRTCQELAEARDA